MRSEGRYFRKILNNSNEDEKKLIGMAITWEISIIEFRDKQETTYKVTKRIPQVSIADTKIYNSKKEVLKQLVDWLN